MDATAPTERDAEQALQAADDLAVGQATLLVEFDNGSLRIGSELGRGGTQGVGISTTKAVVVGSVGVIAMDFFVTRIMISLLY